MEVVIKPNFEGDWEFPNNKYFLLTCPQVSRNQAKCVFTKTQPVQNLSRIMCVCVGGWEVWLDIWVFPTSITPNGRVGALTRVLFDSI